MRKSEAMSGIFGRGLATRQSSTAQYTDGIVIYLYGDFNSLESDRMIILTDYGHDYTAEQLCFKSAVQLNISPLTAPLLALCTTNMDLYLPPNDKITCSRDTVYEYILRVRLIPPENIIGRLATSSLHCSMFNYLFLQMRSDFINDRIDFPEKIIKQEHLLGLGVIDMVRYAKEYQADLRRLEPQDFIPISAKGKFRFVWDRKRLQMNFRPHLDKEYERYKNDNNVSIKLTYVKSILGYAENNYGMETFILPSNGTENYDKRIIVKAYDQTFPGISVYENKSHFHTTIADLMDISLSEDPAGMVHINRRTGMPKVILFDNRHKALSFVSLVDGYYRMQEDYHHHLCKDIESPLLIHLRALRSHGPVSKEWAEARLIERHTRDASFNYLLRQSEKEFGVFTLVYISSQKPVFLQIRQTNNGYYQLADKEDSEPIIATMTELIDHYRQAGLDGGKASITLNKCVFPVKPLDIKIYLCRADTRSSEDNNSLSRQQKTPVCLVSLVHCERLIDTGRFTDIFTTRWEKRTDEVSMQEVAVKRLKSRTSVPQEFFTEALHQAVFWNHPTIITILAVCLAQPISFIFEKADLGALDNYLQRSPHLKMSHLVLAAEQLAQALYYLEGCYEVHGNIRCRNVLVFRHETKGSFIVKLADCGLVHYYCSLPLSDDVNIERLPWIAPECYEKLSIITLDSDLYSFGICLWEIFSYGCRPYNSLLPQEMIYRVKHGNILSKPESCPDDIYIIMKSCWDNIPDARIRPLVIIRNIRSLLAREGDIYNDYNDPQWLDKKPSQGLSFAVKGNDYSCQTFSAHDQRFDNDVNLNSSAAIADNEANAKRLMKVSNILVDSSQADNQKMKGLPKTNDVITSVTTSLDSVGTTIDSGTPLLSPGSSNVSSESLVHCGNGSATPSVLTIMTELENTGSTFVGSPCSLSIVSDHSKLTSIQSRPLPQLPQIGQKLHHWNLKYEPSKTLGQGHYGEVIKGIYTDESGNVQDVAIKRLKKSMTEKYASEFKKEFGIMVHLNHSNIVRIIGKCHDASDCMLLVMEFVSNGCLRDYLKRSENSQITATELLRFGQETAEGMVYLSSQKIIHRDLATRNVLVTTDCHMKISDFGLSRALGIDRDYYKCTDDRTDLPAPWCAPEALLYRKFSESSDVWSFGVTLWEIFSFGMAPRLGEISELPTLIHQGRRLAMPKNCPRPVYELMLFKCWQYYPAERWTFKKILEEIQRLEITMCH